MCTTGKNTDVASALFGDGSTTMAPERFKVAFEVNRPVEMNGEHWMQFRTLDGKNVNATAAAEQLKTDITPEGEQCHQG